MQVDIEKIIPVTEARDNFNKIVDEVEGTEHLYVLTKNGKPSAVVVGVNHLEKLTGDTHDAIAAKVEESNTVDTTKVSKPFVVDNEPATATPDEPIVAPDQTPTPATPSPAVAPTDEPVVKPDQSPAPAPASAPATEDPFAMPATTPSDEPTATPDNTPPTPAPNNTPTPPAQ